MGYIEMFFKKSTDPCWLLCSESRKSRECKMLTLAFYCVLTDCFNVAKNRHLDQFNIRNIYFLVIKFSFKSLIE